MAQFPNTTAADGIWTLKKVRRAILGDNWPEVVIADEFFANTVLLLQADDFADGSQNNTFLDSSTNTHTITRNGNVTQGSFSPFSQDEGKWGVYFDGSGDTLLAPANQSSLDPGSADFTVEGWFNLEDTGTSQTLMIYANPNGSTSNASATAFAVQLQSDQIVRMFAYTGSTAGGAASTTATLNFGEWYHLAMTRSGTTFTLYINGVSSATMTVSGALNADTGRRFYIGNYLNGLTARWIKGYASNVRYVPGTALYASNFTPSTEPLTAVSGTGVLLCQDNRFVDNSSNAHAITVNGDPEVTPFSPFAPSTAYDPATKGGSGYFANPSTKTDYLVVESSTATQLGSAFTIEFWINPETTNTTYSGTSWATFLDADTDAGFSTDDWWLVRQTGSQIFFGNNTNKGVGSASGSIQANAWQHIAITYNGTTAIIYVNGESSGTSNFTTSINGVRSLYIGTQNYASSTRFFRGKLADIRINKEVVYSSDFTPPELPLDPTGSALCLNFTNAGIYDGTGRNVLETVGDAQVDTAVKKYGTGSMQFDGTGDYLSGEVTSLTDFGSGDFTIECWLNLSTINQFNHIVFFGRDQNSGLNCDVSSSNNPRIIAHIGGSWSVVVSGSTTLSADTWYHLAYVRNGSSFKIYVNGVEDGSATNSNAITDPSSDASAVMQVAYFRTAAGADRYLHGYIDDLRITKGVARYTANFTPPAAVLPKQ